MPRSIHVPFALLALAACGDGPTEPRELPVVPDRTVAVTVHVNEGRAAISPLIYGSNQDDGTTRYTLRRYGGNRLTGYNWENNFSSAGSDWQHSSDDFLLWNEGLPAADTLVPAKAVTRFHDQSIAMGAQSIVTLQMAGFVAADGRGTVSAGETAPSARWVRAEPRKGAPFTTTPDRTDGAVYMDELVSLLVGRYGSAAAPDGVQWYSLDNEPALWSSTHPRIHPQPVGAAELVDRSIALASAVKAVDPAARIMGPAAYGMSELVSLQDAPDWAAVRGGREWYVDYYLDRMKAAEATAGRRLLDALDVHYYPEARGDNRVTDPNATTPADVAARLQAPRTLWDASYRENSWIGQYMGAYLPLIPRLKRAIAEHYPGTKLAITEYDFGGGATISGGLAQADVLGIFGKYGVDLATRWGMDATHTYDMAAFRLYLNYDGQGGRFGATSVRATTGDSTSVSAYASIDAADARTLHVILINKTPDVVRVTLATPGAPYGSTQGWGFDATSASVTPRALTGSGESREVSMAGMSGVHVVLRE